MHLFYFKYSKCEHPQNFYVKSYFAHPRPSQSRRFVAGVVVLLELEKVWFPVGRLNVALVSGESR